MPGAVQCIGDHPPVIDMQIDVAAGAIEDQGAGVDDPLVVGAGDGAQRRIAGDRHENGGAIAHDDIRRIVLHRHRPGGQLLDGEEALQAIEGDPCRGGPQQPAEIGVIALAMIGQGGEIDLQQAEVEEAHHPLGAIHQGMGAGADHAEDLLTAVARLHGDGSAELQETAVPAVRPPVDRWSACRR